MADPNSDLWSAIWPGAATVVGSVGGLFLAKFWGGFKFGLTAADKEQAADEAAERKSQRRIDGRQSEELDRAYARADAWEKRCESLEEHYQKRVEEKELRAALWERRARRVDAIAHDLRHKWANERQVYATDSKALPPILSIPLLEEVFD